MIPDGRVCVIVIGAFLKVRVHDFGDPFRGVHPVANYTPPSNSNWLRPCSTMIAHA
jgi:hypothetical protein